MFHWVGVVDVGVREDVHSLGETYYSDEEDYHEVLHVDYYGFYHADKLACLSEDSEEVKELYPHEEAADCVERSLQRGNRRDVL